MDLDTVADELYGLRPQDFTAARDARAAEARKAGDRALAQEIARLRRPSLSAWAGNLLVRQRPDAVAPLLELGEGLRQAHRELDGGQLRELTRRQGSLVAALARQARQLAADAGHPIGDVAQREVEATLHAVLADPDAARPWVAGRLVKPLEQPVGFPAPDAEAVRRTTAANRRVGAERAEPRPRQKDRARGPKDQARGPKDQARGSKDRARDKAAAAREAERRRLVEQAREEAGAARRELEATQEEAAAAESDATDAGHRAEELRQRVAELRERLRQTEAEQREAQTAEREARERSRAADRRLREARRHAMSMATRLAELKGAEGD